MPRPTEKWFRSQQTEKSKMALAEFIARNWDEVMNMPMAEFSKFMESYMSSYDEMLTDKEVVDQSE